MVYWRSRLRAILVATSIVGAGETAASPWAVEVVEYAAGSGPQSGYTDPSTALGMPETMTGEAFGFDGVVSLFNPPFQTDEIVSIGDGGHLTVRMGTPITNDPLHPFGADLIVFGNAGFIDSDYPNGRLGTPADSFGQDPARIEVSEDGAIFYEIVNTFANTMFPTQAYLDVGPYSSAPGTMMSNFRHPMDPTLTLSSFDGLTFAQALTLYDGSGGGTPVNLADAVDGSGDPVSLASVSYVRISYSGGANAEIDALAVVPEPGCAGLMLVAGLFLRRRRRNAKEGE